MNGALLTFVLLVSAEGAQPSPSKREGGIEYSVVSIERKGASMGFGNARITAKPGQQVVELKLRMQAIGDAKCCSASKFVLETTDGKPAEAVWGEMKSEKSTTFALQFTAPKGARFKAFGVNGVTIDLGALPSEMAAAPGTAK